jgi:hypothetical protein
MMWWVVSSLLITCNGRASIMQPSVSRIQILDTGTLASSERKLSRCLICTFSNELLPCGRPRPRLTVAVSVEVEVTMLLFITVIIKPHTNEVVNSFLTKKYPMPVGMGRARPGVPLAPTSPFISFFPANF